MMRLVGEAVYEATVRWLRFSTDRKLVVFCSDDWGGVRVRSRCDQHRLERAGISMQTNRFDRYDTLESDTDLEALFNVLLKYRDSNGEHPIITALCNVANPDFKKIREGGFQEYFYEPFTETLKRYPAHGKVYDLYLEGIKEQIFVPQFHGREHLQVRFWMQCLSNGDSLIHKAFENEFFLLSHGLNGHPRLEAAFDLTNLDELEQHEDILNEGAQIFYQLFGCHPAYFAAPALSYSDRLEKTLSDIGVSLIDVPRFRKMPVGNAKFKTRFHYNSQQNGLGQRYLTRNVVFETNLEGATIDNCLRQISRTFRRKQPVIISNHRASFVGGLDASNRTRGLAMFDLLLKSILKNWPDVEFISASKLFSIWQSQND